MNLLEYIYHPLTPFALLLLIAMLFALWRIARNESDTWESTADEWRRSSDQWESRWEDMMTHNGALRQEIVELAKRAATSPEPLDPVS